MYPVHQRMHRSFDLDPHQRMIHMVDEFSAIIDSIIQSEEAKNICNWLASIELRLFAAYCGVCVGISINIEYGNDDPIVILCQLNNGWFSRR